MARSQRKLLLVLLLTACTTFASAQAPHWVGTWVSSQQIPEPANALPTDDLRDATLRQIVHLTLGGSTLRVRLSNVFGTAPLHLTSVHIAKPVSPASDRIDPSTDRALTFSGKADVTIPSGAEFLSDPIAYKVAPLSDLAVTLHTDNPPTPQTGHPGSRATSYLVHGDLVSAVSLPNPKKFDHWFLLTGIDVIAPRNAAAIVTLGDSITDGHASTTNGNNRWPDVLARHLQSNPATRNLAVLNQGIGGNHLIREGGHGPTAIMRFDRDVLAPPAVRYLLVLEGINDIGSFGRTGNTSPAANDLLVQHMIAGLQQIVARAHDHGIKVIGCTITAFVDSHAYHPAPIFEADRKRVNAWIRTPGHFDAVVDFDKLTADPANPDHLNPKFDSGDHLHPSPAGYHAMGEAIPLTLFTH